MASLIWHMSEIAVVSVKKTQPPKTKTAHKRVQNISKVALTWDPYKMTQPRFSIIQSNWYHPIGNIFSGLALWSKLCCGIEIDPLFNPFNYTLRSH